MLENYVLFYLLYDFWMCLFIWSREKIYRCCLFVVVCSICYIKSVKLRFKDVVNCIYCEWMIVVIIELWIVGIYIEDMRLYYGNRI